jgi:hypothetical protein
MWMLFARPPPPDRPYWPGRRWLAVIDAVAWPAAWVVGLRSLPVETGIVAPLLGALAIVAGMGRVRTALRQNHRYRFTTWRWGKVLGWTLLIGLLLRSLVQT